VDGSQWIWMSLILVILSIILDLINKYINLEPKETILLGSCIGTWNVLLGKKREKKESRAGGSALSSNTPSGLWFDAAALASPHPSSVSSPCRPSVSSVVRSVGVEASSLGSALCRWVNLPPPSLGYPSSLGSAFRRWVLPFVVWLYPSSLGSTQRRCCCISSVSAPSSSSCAICLVLRLYGTSGGLTPCRSGLRCVGGPGASLFDPTRCRLVLGLIVRLHACHLACFDVVESLSMSWNPY